MAKRDYYELLGVSRDARATRTSRSRAPVGGFLESLKKLFGG
jgi:hypothetical protein